MFSQPEDQLLSGRREEELVPTFYLGGQPYIFDHDTVAQGGPALAKAALLETLGYAWHIFGEWQAGALARDERLKRMTELCMGVFLLRDLIPDRDLLLPNSSPAITH